MKKIKQFANNAFRPDRTEVLTESLQRAEERIDKIKLTCESLAKKVHDCLQVKGKDAMIEKRIKKVPEFLLGSAMINNGKSLGDGSILGEVLAESGQIEMKLGQEVVKYEVQIEECILKPLQQLMENDLPSIYKLKRQLAKYTSDMDIAKGKLGQVNRHSMNVGGGGAGQNSGGGSGNNKADSVREEYDDALLKVEQCRDNLAAEMYALIARESEIAKLIVDFLNYQKEYHSSVHAILEELISNVDSCVASSMHKPVYGQGLLDHLSSSGRTIAYPIELCVCALIETTGLEEEGLFRIAGSTSKVKKLKSAFDATLMDLDGLLSEFCDSHVIANALKCYLRELPEPLLTFELYNDWINAIRISDPTQKQEALWIVIQKLPKQHFENLRYLIKFLKDLSSHQDVNKMSVANIAIVIGPNLLWPQPPSLTSTTADGDTDFDNSSQMGLNMTMTHLYSSVVEQLVSNCSYFFPDDIDFFVTCTKPTPPDSSPHLVNGSTTIPEEITSKSNSNSGELAMKRSTSNSSIDDGNQSPTSQTTGRDGSPKPILRRNKKNKPAPTPPAPPSQSKIEKDSKQNKNPLANMKPFSGQTNYKVASPSSAKNEKREGLWIPPSPKELGRKNQTPHPQNQPPVKPPPPVYQNTEQSISAKQKFLLESGPPPKPDSPLKYKSSFTSSKSNSVESNTSNSTLNNKIVTSNTTDNIDSSSSSKSVGPVSSSNFGANASNFASLPRHFHTENSYKNQGNNQKAVPPGRPPSMFGIPPPAPPIQAPQAAAVQDKEKTVGGGIGFEKLEAEVLKEKDQKKIELPSPSDSISRPIPAPRSSLLSQSQSFKETNTSSNNSNETATIVARERPSIMAKPRDLSRRNLSNSSQSELINNDQQQTSHQNENKNPSSHDDHLDFSKNNGGSNLSNTSPPLSPDEKLSFAKPPRPQPPAAAAAASGPKSKISQESTDL